MSTFLLLILHLLLFGFPTIIIAKFVFIQYHLFAYVYFGFMFVFSQILDVTYSISLNSGIVLTGGDVAYSSLLLITLFLVIISQNPSIVRSLLVIQIFLNIFLFLLYELIILTLNSPGTLNLFAIPPSLFGSTIFLNALNTLLFILEVLFMFSVFEVIKRKMLKIGGQIFFLALVFIGTLCMDGFLYPLMAFAVEPSLGNTLVNGTLGNMILGLGLSPFLVVFLLMEKKNFTKFSQTPLLLTRLVFPSKRVLMKRLEKAEHQVAVLEGLLPVCPSCKKVRDDRGYWNQLESYVKTHSTVKFTSSLCPDCQAQNHKLVLSYFDIQRGPVILLTAPKQTALGQLAELPTVMDLAVEPFFMHSFSEFDTANRFFSILCPDIRGNRIDFMISYVVKKGTLDIPFVKQLLEEFITQFTQVKDVSLLFLGPPKISEHLKQEKFHEVETMFAAFFKAIIDEKTKFYLHEL